MTIKFKLGFLKSSASSSDKFLLDNTSESSCDVKPSPKFKRFFTLRRKRNDSQVQPIRDLGKGDSSARASYPSAEVTSALAISSSTSTVPGKQLATLLFHSQPQPQPPPPVPVDASRQTGGSQKFAGHHFEMTERVVSIEAPDSMEKNNQPYQESESLGRRTTLVEVAETQQERPDMNSGIDLHGTLSNNHPLASTSPKIADSPPLSSQSHIAMHAHEENLQIQSADQRYEVSKLQHILEVLQRAARRVQVDQSMSQLSIFRSLAPLVIFLYLLEIGVLIPRYRGVQTPDSIVKMILLFFVGMALALVALRGMVWLMSVFGKAFCEVDLTEVFRRGECVDVDGRGMGEAELIIGGIFM